LNTPQLVATEGLLKGMDAISVLYDHKQAYVPEILLAAQALNAGLQECSNLEAMESKGKVLIYTADGDLHDIGKKEQADCRAGLFAHDPHQERVFGDGRSARDPGMAEKGMMYVRTCRNTLSWLLTELKGASAFMAARWEGSSLRACRPQRRQSSSRRCFVMEGILSSSWRSQNGTIAVSFASWKGNNEDS
jgi:hypothetical protein